MILILLLATIVFNFDAAAFRPGGPIRRTGFAPKHLLLPTIRYDRLSLFPLKSSDINGDDGVVPVQKKRSTKNNAGNVDTNDDSNKNDNDSQVNALLDLLDSVPSNMPTPRSLTNKILDVVRELEEDCPTPNGSVLSALSGNWELLWTAQDRSS